MFRFIMRAVLFGFILAATFTTSFAVDRYTDAPVIIRDGDGTYKTVTVNSAKECSAICQSEPLCRGAVTYQADITKPEAECRLNDGLSETSPFKVTPPEELSLDIAVADLNAYRAEYGLGPVTLNTKLIQASDVHAQDLAIHGNAAHEGSDGSTHSDRIQRQGYYFTVAGENVATGQKSWDKVFKAWQDSPGHNENLLLADATEFGIALVYEPTTTYLTYWTMLMAAPMPNFSHLEEAMTVEQMQLLQAQP
ncbi:CAP domain-containing protein [Fretibacter rubidus]|uniref:CAP domain-containing protein n=1 Tax=Fretibacter rubidus TaxID=570162 RepID=UPI00352A26D2